MKQPLTARFQEVNRVPTPWDDAVNGIGKARGKRPPLAVVPLRGSGQAARSARRFAASIAIAAALVVGLVVVLPTVGGDGARNRAFAVTENADGTVTVEIRSIEDAEGLERQLAESGVPAAVYYLPAGKVCNPRQQGDDSPPPVEDRQLEMEHQRLTVRKSSDGAFVFTIDRSRLLPGYTLLIYTQYDVPKQGQPGAAVPSIAAGYTSGDVSQCQLVDGDAGAWPIQ